MFKSITLHTNKLIDMRHFYLTVLEFPTLKTSVDSFTIKVGESSLTFLASKKPASYHFAFNIPGNQIQLAKNWLKGKVPLNLENGKDELYYESFDADTIYFEDPSGNVVELIGRRSQKGETCFSVASIVNISEISITTPFVEESAEKLGDSGVFSRNNNPIKSNSLNFLGSKGTYIILVPPNRRWYFSEKMSLTCPLEIELINNRRIAVDIKGYITTFEQL